MIKNEGRMVDMKVEKMKAKDRIERAKMMTNDELNKQLEIYNKPLMKKVKKTSVKLKGSKS